MPLRKMLILSILASCITSCTEPAADTSSPAPEVIAEPTNQVKLSSEINWEQLNPARGDKSPRAGTIWGDRKGSVATGFLAKFVDGFSSPPHIHNVTYRAMVLKGLIHNDDPAAEKMWMPAGSFWTQPAGESHITSAKGEEVIAYVEIDQGPYLVMPIEEAFDNGERPINVDKSNLIWLDASKTKIIENHPSTIGTAVAFLWENNELTGNLIKLPAGFVGDVSSQADQFHAVVITGEVNYTLPKSNAIKALDPGSYFTSKGHSKHQLEVKKDEATVIYLRTNGVFHIQSRQ